MPRFEPCGLGQRAADRAGYTMTIAEAAVRLGVVPATLARWRSVGIGPSWWKGPHPSSPIFYRPAEIPGQVAWRLTDLEPLNEPILLSGLQGIWRLTHERRLAALQAQEKRATR